MTPVRDREKCVPTSVLRDILRREFPPYAWKDGLLQGRTLREIARECRVDEKQIRRIMNGETTWSKFALADKILTRLGLMQEWHAHPGLIEVGQYLDSLPPAKPWVPRSQRAAA